MSHKAPFDLVAALIAHRLFERFPNLRMASIEMGAFWVPWLFQSLERTYGPEPEELLRGSLRDVPETHLDRALPRGQLARPQRPDRRRQHAARLGLAPRRGPARPDGFRARAERLQRPRDQAGHAGQRARDSPSDGRSLRDDPEEKEDESMRAALLEKTQQPLAIVDDIKVESPRLARSRRAGDALRDLPFRSHDDRLALRARSYRWSSVTKRRASSRRSAAR